MAKKRPGMSPEEQAEHDARREKIDRLIDERLRQVEDELLARAEARERAEQERREPEPKRHRLFRFLSR